MKSGLLVLGMHRGGTSALTGCLPPFGVELSSDLMRPDPRNAKGFFESRQVCMIMESFLSECGSFWHDWRSLDIEQAGSKAQQVVCRDLSGLLERDFSRSPAFALKDPRNCRAVPIWLRVFSEIDVDPAMIILLRHPVCVAMSLAERDGMSFDKALFLWLRHMLDAERETRSCKRTFLLYDDLLGDWRSSLGRIGRLIGSDWTDRSVGRDQAIEAHLSKALRHYLPGPDAIAMMKTVGPWFGDAWAELSRCASEDSEPDVSSLDKINADFTSTCRHFALYFSRTEGELALLRNSGLGPYRAGMSIAQTRACASRLESAAARRLRRLLGWQ